MKNEYLIVDKRILPDYFEKVVEARSLLAEGAVGEVSEAVKRVGISRSTYYKYKDFIFTPDSDTAGRMAVLSLMLNHEQGVLSEVLAALSAEGANILTIMQNLPINGLANVVISADISHVAKPLEDLVKRLGMVRGASKAKLVSVG